MEEIREEIRKAKQADPEVPIHVELIGAINKTVQRFGVPVDSVIPVTTFSEASDIMNELLADEARNMLASGLLTYSSSDNRLRRYSKTDNTFTIKALYRLGYKWPITDEAYLFRVIESLDSLGFFDRDDI